MPKRKLTKQQRVRIARNQIQRRLNAELTADVGKIDGSSQSLSAEKPGLIISHYGQQLDVESLSEEDDHEVYRCYQRANLPPLVTGDRVTWQADAPDKGIVVAVDERENVLRRPNSLGEIKAIAANVDLVVVVIAVTPEPFYNLIDRYLVAVEQTGLQAVLLLNKTDLIDATNAESLQEIVQLYQSIGYPVIRASTTNDDGINEVRTCLANKTAVFVGQSGVGKSSLLNRLHPAAHAEVSALSLGKAKGTHTTTTAKLFHLQECDLIDSPGIREFGLGHISADELFHGFVEFKALAGHCRFNDCAHQTEPDCAIRQAIDEGKIRQQRLDSYFHILSTL